MGRKAPKALRITAKESGYNRYDRQDHVCAAIAGMNFDDDAVELAVANGMYLIKIIEDADNDRIEVTSPANGAKPW